MPSQSGLKERVLTAVIAGPLFIFLLYVGGIPFIILAAILLAVALREWLMMTACHPTRITLNIMGILYLGIAFASFMLLRLDLPHGFFWSIALILTIWASDTGGYIVGRTIGGPKLAPKISPKKTWSGLCGALFFSGVALCLCLLYAEIFVKNSYNAPLFYGFVAGCIIGVLGQIGDLSISILKRKVGVKDTGNLFPGHGGLLDRADSLLIVSPVYLTVVLLFLR